MKDTHDTSITPPLNPLPREGRDMLQPVWG